MTPLWPSLRKQSPADWFALIQAYGMLLLVALALRCLPFASVLNFIRARASAPRKPKVGGQADRTIARLAAAFEIASRYNFCRTTCLNRALGLYLLLWQKGIQSRLLIGVEKRYEKINGHAWLEYNDRVILDPPETRARFKMLLSF